MKKEFKYCKICNKIFFKNYFYSSKYWEKQIYCSLKCYGISKKGKPTWNKGKKASEEDRRKNSKGHLGIYVGNKSPNWKGGLTSASAKIRNSITYHIWREAVFARDNWTCQDCFKIGTVLNAHHIKSFAKYPELRFAIDNGKTLCLKCHKKIKHITAKF